MSEPRAKAVDLLALGAIRRAGGIVHSDGNVFFTSTGQFRRAIEELFKVPLEQQPHNAGVTEVPHG
jgi:hypothetical protein